VVTDRARAIRRPLADLGLFLLLCLIWGITYVVLKVGLREAPPLTFAALRALTGGVALVAYALVTTRQFPLDRLTHQTAAFLGITNVAAFLACLNLASARLSAGETSILTYTQPLLVALLAYLWLREPLSRRALAGLLLGFAGVVVVVADKVHLAGSPSWLGYAFGLGGAAAWTVGTVYFRARQRGLNLAWVTALQTVYGAVPLVLLGLFVERPVLTPSFELAWTVAYVGLGSSALAYLIWFYLLRHRPAAEVTAYIFLVPFFAVLSGVLALGEGLSVGTLVGGGLILGGIYAVNGRRATAPASAPVGDVVTEA
jgi:probable blue pigment (indigoidine) exporter